MQTRFDRTLRIVMWVDAFLSLAAVLVSVAVVALAAAMPQAMDARGLVGVVVILSSVVLAACGAITGVALMLRMNHGDYAMPSNLRLPLPGPMRPEP